MNPSAEERLTAMWPYGYPTHFELAKSEIVELLDRAYRDGQRDGMERAALICQAGCQPELANAIRAAMEEEKP